MRRTKPEKRVTPGDIRYNSILVQGFVNSLMRRGKKSTARRVLYDAFGLIEERSKRDPLEVFELAMKNVSPLLEVKPRRVGGATYQVPVEVAPERRISLAHRWILAGLPGARRPLDGREAGRRADGRRQQHRRSYQTPRRSAQDGGGQPGLCPLSLVIGRQSCPRAALTEDGTGTPARALPKYRHHRSYRCRQDNHHRAGALLYRSDAPTWFR